MTGVRLNPGEREPRPHLLEPPTTDPLKGRSEPQLRDAQHARPDTTRRPGFTLAHHPATGPTREATP